MNIVKTGASVQFQYGNLMWIPYLQQTMKLDGPDMSKDVCKYGMGMYEPIILNNRILRLLGFNNSRWHTHRFLYENLPSPFISKNDGLYYVPWRKNPIEYLHTLQNWFYIIEDRELEIDKFKLSQILCKYGNGK